jgi:hypothetical protein
MRLMRISILPCTHRTSRFFGSRATSSQPSQSQRRIGHPQGLGLNLGSELLEWYHPAGALNCGDHGDSAGRLAHQSSSADIEMSLRVTKKQWILIAGWAAIGIIGAVLNTLMMQPTIHERFRQNPGYRSYVQHRAVALNPMFLVPYVVVLGILLVWSLRPPPSQQQESLRLTALGLVLFSLLGLVFSLIFKL